MVTCHWGVFFSCLLSESWWSLPMLLHDTFHQQHLPSGHSEGSIWRVLSGRCRALSVTWEHRPGRQVYRDGLSLSPFVLFSSYFLRIRYMVRWQMVQSLFLIWANILDHTYPWLCSKFSINSLNYVPVGWQLAIGKRLWPTTTWSCVARAQPVNHSRISMFISEICNKQVKHQWTRSITEYLYMGEMYWGHKLFTNEMDNTTI